MDIQLTDDVSLRSLLYGDASGLAKHGDNPNIAVNQRESFPVPYTIEHARHWIQHAKEHETESRFAIATQKEAIGEIGFLMQGDVHRNSAEISFWISEEYWGQGIVTKAVNSVAEYAFKKRGIKRLFADVIEYNIGSQKVLVKCGFQLEGVLRKNICKNGKYYDQYVYARLDEDDYPTIH